MVRISLSIFMVAFLFLTVSQITYSQETLSLGCCVTVKGTPTCVGCGDDGLNCAIDGSLCVETNSFTLGKVCTNSSMAEEAVCEVPTTTGCCVASEGSCTENVNFDSCSAQHWFEGSSCSDIPECSPAEESNFLDRIIIILAVLIVIVLLILFRRKRPHA